MSFDRLARHYNWMERILAGEKLQRCRLRWLDEVKDCHNVLLVGEGHGKFLQECARALPNAKIACVDASAQMLEVSRAKLRAAQGGDQWKDRVSFIHGELPNVALPEGAFDLLATNFFLDCFGSEDLPRIVNCLASTLKPGGQWLISEFHEPTSGWKRARARSILALAYAFFQIATRLPARRLPNYAPLLKERGFRLRAQEFFDWELLVSELWRAP